MCFYSDVDKNSIVSIKTELYYDDAGLCERKKRSSHVCNIWAHKESNSPHSFLNEMKWLHFKGLGSIIMVCLGGVFWYISHSVSS